MKSISLILLLALTTYCSSNRIRYTYYSPLDYIEKNIFMKDSFDIQGHRGCRGLMPENTVGAMIRALDLGVTTLEMDVE
jgi:glycerophosphoryl diester phosphodiesterase